MHERARDILLAYWGRTVAAHPGVTLTLCVALAAASVVLAVTGMEFHTDRSTLVDPEKPWN
jgi:hypothetical protein